jgi:hypothetical protein
MKDPSRELNMEFFSRCCYDSYCELPSVMLTGPELMQRVTDGFKTSFSNFSFSGHKYKNIKSRK